MGERGAPPCIVGCPDPTILVVLGVLVLVLVLVLVVLGSVGELGTSQCSDCHQEFPTNGTILGCKESS